MADTFVQQAVDPEQPATTPGAPGWLRAGCLPALLFCYILLALLAGQLARLAALVAGFTLSHNVALLVSALLVLPALGGVLMRGAAGRARAA